MDLTAFLVALHCRLEKLNCFRNPALLESQVAQEVMRFRQRRVQGQRILKQVGCPGFGIRMTSLRQLYEHFPIVLVKQGALRKLADRFFKGSQCLSNHSCAKLCYSRAAVSLWVRRPKLD